jgi:hypothetical protein
MIGMLAAGSAQAAAAARQRFFLSPSGNISCEIDLDLAGRSDAYCQTERPSRSVTLTPSGQLRICEGIGCIGDPPENDKTLPYGHHTRLGPFRCTSAVTGVRCTVRKSGRGFRIRRAGIRRI